MTTKNQNADERPTVDPIHDTQPVNFGPFITRVVGLDRDEEPCVITSRRHRKQLQPLKLIDWERLLHEPVPAKCWLRFWAPARLSWWMAILFMIGSALFALGSALAIFPSFLSQWWHTPLGNNLVFFVGSIFFTVAAALQLLQSINSDISTDFNRPDRKWRWFGWRPRNLGYLASLIQFIGTILFNINTGDALFPDLSSTEKNLAIWTPDMIGSICFLASSTLGYLEISHRIGYCNFRDITMWIAISNGIGSIAFQIAAFASFTLATNQSWWTAGSDWGIFVGGVSFLLGSYLLIPEIFEKEGEIEEIEGDGRPLELAG